MGATLLNRLWTIFTVICTLNCGVHSHEETLHLEDLNHLHDMISVKESDIREWISFSGWKKSDPSLHYADQLLISVHPHYNDQHIIRIRPHLDGIPVIGGERILLRNKRRVEMGRIGGKLPHPRLRKRSLDWPLNSTIIKKLAIDNSFHSRSLHLTSSEQDLSLERAYFMHYGEMRPVWKVYDASATVFERQIRFFDGQTGSILSVVPTVSHFEHQGYVFSNNNGKLNLGSTPPLTPLLDVVNFTDNTLSRAIVGRDFQSSNACFFYRCNNTSNGTCTVRDSYCVDVKPGMIEGKDYFSHSHSFAVNGKFIDYYRNWKADGYPDGLVFMSWKRSQVFAPRLSQPTNVSQSGNMIWGEGIDFSAYNGKELDDSFSELQVYHWMTLHNQFLKNLMNVTEFCYLGTGPNCTVRDTRTNRTATSIDYPLRIAVNMQSIQMNPDKSSAYPDLLTQIAQGKGKSQSDPVVFDQAAEYPNAYFAWEPTQPDINSTSQQSCQNGSCINIKSFGFNHFGFGQTNESDWALSPCIVFHELTHAFVQKFIPYLPWYRWSEQGVSSDPGALNEGWADYIAAIHCNASDFRSTYSGHPKRSLQNNMTCQDMVGEIHTDSMVFTGALWAVRSQIPLTSGLSNNDMIEFDRIVLQTIMIGQPTDDFASVLRLVIRLMKSHDKLKVLQPFAEQEFNRRVFSCTRIKPVDESMDVTFVLGDARLTAANVSTVPTILSFEPRASDWGMFFSWKQLAVSPILGVSDTGYATSLLLYVFDQENCRLFVTQEGPILPYRECNSRSRNETLTWSRSAYSEAAKSGSVWINLSNGRSNIQLLIAHREPIDMILFASSLVLCGAHLVWRYTIAVTALVSTFLFWIPFFGSIGYICFYSLKHSFRRRESIPSETSGTSTEVLSDFNNKRTTTSPAYAFSWKRGLSHAPNFMLLYMFAAGLGFAASGALALLALIFGRVRDFFTWLMIVPLFWVCLMDILFGYYLKKRLLSDFHKSAFTVESLPRILRWYKPRRDAFSSLDELLSITVFAWILFAAGAMTTFFFDRTPLAVHGILYFCFLFLWASRFFLVTLFIIKAVVFALRQ